MRIIADNHIPYVADYFGSSGELILKSGRAISHQDVKDADLLLVRSITHVDKKLLANTKVKFVGSVTAGADHLDTKWLDEAHIAWSVAKGFNAPPVADYVVSVISALQRKQVITDKKFRAAVIGVGHVGNLVVESLKLLNFEVVLCDPLRAEHEKQFVSTALNDLHDLDLISLHVPLTKTGPYATYHFIDEKFLKRQKPGCVLLNASRGAVIHSEDLLNHGTHLHWCLDVFEHEPKINKAILEHALIATPHIAGYSLQSKIRGIDMIYQIACQRKIIEPKPYNPKVMPQQKLSFAGVRHHWQDIVLGAFNPLVITKMMRAILLPAKDTDALFDEMRNQFNYRHEFKFTKIYDTQVSNDSKIILQKLGFQFL